MIAAVDSEEALSRLGVEKLTPSELKIARMVLQGKRTKEMAVLLTLAPITIKTHQRNLYSKCQVSGQVGLMAKFMQLRGVAL